MDGYYAYIIDADGHVINRVESRLRAPRRTPSSAPRVWSTGMTSSFGSGIARSRPSVTTIGRNRNFSGACKLRSARVAPARSPETTASASSQPRRSLGDLSAVAQRAKAEAVGKPLLVFRNRVKSKIIKNQKYFAFSEGQISGISLAIPSCSEGRWPSSRTLGGSRWTPMLRLTSAAEAYGKDAWS